MDHVHVRERLAAFAGRIRRAAGPAGEPGTSSRPAHETLAGLRAMNSLGAGRR
jgi:hypothetical protein